MTHEAWRLVGEPRFGGILVVSDHASNRVPEDIELGLDPALMEQHIALDLGVEGVAERLARHAGIAAFLGNVSRLVCDFNRAAHDFSSVPEASDGKEIPGNFMADREARLDRFYWPYHNSLEAILSETPQALLLSLHSFTPKLDSDPHSERPWDCGVLYNNDDRAARIAIPLLEAEGLVVGDNEPYSGKILNNTMDRHAEGEGRPYFGIEIRQDRLATPEMQDEWAARLHRICNAVAIELTG
ncbi:MAG TPA: N-formylglutamate amidohydrolase [Sphingomonadaceae bacterium]|nr:N-formylglutamate amidohydrolase [Sphingomonadaceae bacterium]